MRLGLAAALVFGAAWALGTDFAPLFDGARGQRPHRHGALEAPPEAQGRPVERPTPELVAARQRWGWRAQAARLGPGSESFRFAVVGDMEDGRFPWQKIFLPGKDAAARVWRAAEASGPDFIIQLGDFVSLGTVANYKSHLGFLERESRAPVFFAIGNHDRSAPNGPADKGLYEAVFGPTDYFFDYGGWRFIALDTADRKLTDAQLAWLDQALDSGRRNVIFTHVPPAFMKKKIRSCGIRPQEEAPVEAEGYWKDFITGWFKDGSEGFEAAVRGRVERVYMGHVHAFGVGEHQGVRYVLTGGGGSPLYPLPPGEPQCKFAHFIDVEAGPAGLIETVQELDGSRFRIP